MPSVIKGDSNVNLDFSTGGRITGDFSNATLANRVYAQTSTTNGSTSFGVIPNGTGASSAYNVFAASDPTNTSFAQLRAGTDTSDVRLTSGISGSGSYLPMTFYTGGSERMRVDTSGNVGIGTSSPSAKLTSAHPQGSYGSSNKYFSGLYNNTEFFNLFMDAQWVTHLSAPTVSGQSTGIAFDTAGSERARIDSSGNLLVGTTAVYGKISVVANTNSNNDVWIRNDNAGSSSACGVVLNASGNSWRMGMGSTANNSNALTWVVDVGGANSEKMRLDTSGRLLVGKTTNGDYVTGIEMQPAGAVLSYRTSGVAGIFGRTDNGETVRFTNNGNGVGNISTTGSATAYNTSSDYRLKHDIAPMTGALAKVAQLKPCTYKWNADNSQDEGFIAHELQEVCPSAVTGEKDAVDAEGNPQYQGIDTSFLVATLTAAIQELKAIVDAQGAEIAALKGTA